jgi:hypothetical protein
MFQCAGNLLSRKKLTGSFEGEFSELARRQFGARKPAPYSDVDKKPRRSPIEIEWVAIGEREYYQRSDNCRATLRGRSIKE